MIQPKGTKILSDNLIKEMNRLTKTDLVNWNFIYVEDSDLLKVYQSLKTDFILWIQTQALLTYLSLIEILI